MKMDFEKFCAKYGVISDKSTGKKTMLKLNGAQRVVLNHLEKCRKSNLPCRLLILKSRQLGISTLLEHYFTWLLIFHCEMETFLSLCHNNKLSKSFIDSISKIYDQYDNELKLKKVSDNILEDKNGNKLIYGSAKSYNSMRGFNISVAHLSESAFWHTKTTDWSEEVIRGVMGSVGNRGGTFIVMESTSDGRNNFFYRLWCDSMKGLTSFYPIFLGWNLCEYYIKPLSDEDKEAMNVLNEREKYLLEQGCSMEQLNWYRYKRSEFQDETAFLREFPINADESFLMGSNLVFNQDEIDIYKTNGKLGNVCDIEKIRGKYYIVPGFEWQQWGDKDLREHGFRYFVVVTIGGSADDSAFHAITCWSMNEKGVVELRLERLYRCDIDTLIDDSVMVSHLFKNAMLIVDVDNLDRLGLSSKEYYIRKLKKKYSRLFVEKGQVGYRMSHMRKLRGLFAFRKRLKDKTIIDYSKDMLVEMNDFYLEGEEITNGCDSEQTLLLCRLILCDVLEIIGPFKQLANVNDFLIKNYALLP